MNPKNLCVRSRSAKSPSAFRSVSHNFLAALQLILAFRVSHGRQQDPTSVPNLQSWSHTKLSKFQVAYERMRNLVAQSGRRQAGT
jgi:hypothetical protein